MNPKLLEVCGSLARASVVLDATRQVVANGERPTPTTVGALLPETKYPGLGEVGQDECDAAFEVIEAEAEAHAASLNAEQPAEVSHNADTDQASREQAEPAPTISRDEALENLRQAHIALANARAAVLTLTNKRQAARTALSEAISCWQSGLPRVTREQAVRDAIATHQMTRAERAAPPPSGPSYWDRVKSYGAGGDGNEWARKQHVNGGNMRGAFPRQALGRRVKVPSQQ